MTQSHNPDKQPEPGFNQRLRFLLLSRTSIALGVLTLLVGLAGGAWWLWIFVYEQLAPLVEKNLTQTLNRPVQLGRVEQFSLTGLRFGASSVPATPTDPDRVSVDAVDVSFDLLQLVFTRTLELDVTLVNPDVYVEQDKKGDWISNTLAAQDSSGPIKTNLDTIRFRNADVVLVPQPAVSSGQSARTPNARAPKKELVAIKQVNGAAQFLENNQLIRFYLDGQPVTGGTLALQGETRLKTLQTNLQLQAQNLLAPVVTHLVKLPLELQAGRVDGKLKIQLTPEQQLSIFGTANLKAVTAAISQLPQPFINTQGTLRFKGKQVQLDDVKTSYGKIPLIANGAIGTETGYNVSGRVKAVSVANAQQTLGIELPVPVTGEARAAAQLTGPILKPILSGTVATTKPARIDRVSFSNIRTRFAFSAATFVTTFKDIQATPTVGGKITGAGSIQLGQKPGLDFDLVARNLPGDAIAKTYGATPPIQIGTVKAIAKISGTPANPQTVVSWQAPQATYPAYGKVIIAGINTWLFRNTVANVAGGTVRAAGQLVDGRWAASLQADGIQLGRLGSNTALQAPLSGTFNLSGTTDSFNPVGAGSTNMPVGKQTGWSNPPLLRATGSGRVNVANGTVTASNIQLAEGQWQVLGTVAGVQLGRILPQLPPQLLLTLRDGKFNLSGSLTAITPETISGTVSARLRAAGGTVTATNVTLRNGRWQGSFAADGVEVGTLAQLPLSARFSPQLEGRLSGNVNASGPLAANSIADIQASGQLRLLSFAANGLDFDPVLSGKVNIAAGQGVNLQLAGVQDRIELVLSPTYQPVSFLVRRSEALATGRTQGDLLLVRSENFPLSILKTIAPTPEAIASQPVAGELDGNLAINLNTFAVEGNVAIAQPAISTIRGDSFVAQFRYANGVGTLNGGEFTQGESRYALRGTITQTPNGPQVQGQVNITQGQVQNVLTALQFFDLQDFQRGLQPRTYARASVINTVPVGLPQASLLTQLRRFSEIEALLQQQRQQRRDNSPLPSLADLQGTFGGEISLSGSLQNGVEVNFELEGKNWEWGSYKASQIIAQGSFENGVLTLLPLRIESDETLVAFNGQVGGTQQSGQLRVRNFPVKELNNFVKLPVELTGQLNATATLAGSLQNPQALGELQLTEGTLNQKPIESALGSFSYVNARLNFGTQVMISGPDPIAITGSVPAQLPFATVLPDSNEISLNVNVQNEGLALLNLLTNSFAWEGGQGQVQLQVIGTIEQPVATGIATVNNATISAQALPEPLTDVTGTARFNGNRIQVEGIQGKFSRGNVQARGVIPIFDNLEPDDPDSTNPLTVTLDQLALNLAGLYQGGASGNVVITGSALSPIIGGEVRLAQGQVSLPDSEAAGPTASPPATPATPAPPALSPDDGTVPEFNNLRLTLGERIEITRPPILNFQATGTLTLNGNRNDIRPDGTIRLRSGGVNLFTTQFVLARGNENTATFSPNQGLDPNLDIELVARVPEVTQRQVPSSPLSAEINQPLSTELGALETVRVQATITGPASQLFDNLELTSNPSRSETEIIALLGGGFVNTLGRGDSTLGFANLAGSALLGNFQGTVTNIGNAFGLSELRLFPTVITSERTRTSSTLGLAAEAGIDISSNLSVSILRVLTADQPTQFGLSYRVNNQVRLRTSTDFSGESRAVVEYENRF